MSKYLVLMSQYVQSQILQQQHSTTIHRVQVSISMGSTCHNTVNFYSCTHHVPRVQGEGEYLERWVIWNSQAKSSANHMQATSIISPLHCLQHRWLHEGQTTYNKLKVTGSVKLPPPPSFYFNFHTFYSNFT